MQDKWDAAGATQACIRVIARRSGRIVNQYRENKWPV